MATVSQTFPHAKKPVLGYDVDEVETFLASARLAYDAEPGDTGTMITAKSIREMGFKLVKGGYSTTHVDTALERLEDAFAARERNKGASEKSEEEWFADARGRAKEILARIERPKKHKFASAGLFRLGYDKRDVDDFADTLRSYFREGETVEIDDVRRVVFRSRRGGYREAQVDAVLDSVVDVMLAVR